MTPEIKREDDGSLTFSVNVRLSGSLLEQEEEIARILNELGRKATAEALGGFDSNGDPVVVDNQKHTSKGTQKKSIRRRTDPSS